MTNKKLDKLLEIEHMQWVPPGCVAFDRFHTGIYSDPECTDKIGKITGDLPVFVVATLGRPGPTFGGARINFVITSKHMGWTYVSPGAVNETTIYDGSKLGSP